MALPAIKIALASTALHCAITFLPVLIYGVSKKSQSIILASLAVIALDLMQTGVLFSPVPYPSALANLHYNWIQKGLVFLVCAFIIWRSKKSDQCGMQIPDKPSGFALALLIGILFAGLDLLLNQNDPMRVDRETVFFQLTMPGLQEEILYRGLMLYFLDKSLGTPWKFLGVQFGWGAILTSALFAFGHLMIFDPNLQLQIDPSPLAWINQFSFALVMCWLRYYTNSAWTAVLAHNLDNGLMALKLYATQ